MSGNAETHDSALELEGSGSPVQPVISFDQVIAIVEAAPGLTDGVRGNVLSAVRRAASMMPGAAGTTGMVNIEALRRKLEKATPAKMGFKHSGSLSAFRSNLQRALQLAGFTMMPGRHSTRLLPELAALLEKLDEKTRRKVSRLMHVASEHKLPPARIDNAFFQHFCHLVENTCIRSKARKTIRNTAKAWNKAMKTVPGWPDNHLVAGSRDDWYYSLDWSVFPPSFRADVEAYLDRGESALDFLDATEELPPLESRTRDNYRDGFKRAASILVKTGVPAEAITGIASLIEPKRARSILMFLHERLGRKDGGLLGLVAMLLYTGARDWVHPQANGESAEANVVKTLERFFKNTKLKKQGMSEKTRTRLGAFDDARTLTEYVNLPKRLVEQANKLPVNEESARLVRLALFVAIELDTLLRPGNVVGLNLKDNLQDTGEGPKREMFVIVPKTKNGMPFHGKLRPRTVTIFDLYMSKYRSCHAGGHSEWLFPGTKEAHWRTGRACESLKDYCAKHLGIEMTPHVHRSLGGKIILSENPGALVEVQQALGHKRFATTRSSYIPYEMAATQARYHAVLARREAGLEPEYL